MQTKPTLEIPEKMDELIEVYLRQQAQRLIDAKIPGSDYISCSVAVYSLYENSLTYQASVGTHILDESGINQTYHKGNLPEAVDMHLEKAKSNDPIARKRAEIDKLIREVSNMEADRLNKPLVEEVAL